MKSTNQFGMRAVVSMKNGEIRTYNNLTEIHYNHGFYKDSTAFESNIHGTGYNIKTEEISEFEIFPADKLEKSI